MRIVLLGAPGSGKGTQAKFISKKYNVPHISTGQILRDEIESGSKLGKGVKPFMANGELVPDELVLEALNARYTRSDAKRGFILDGFPRSIPQAQELDSQLALVGKPLQIALTFKADIELLVKRITGRLICAECAAVFNSYFSKPAKQGICDSCETKGLKRRADDNEKTVRTRMASYFEETEPLVTYYRAQHKLRSVSAEDDIDVIKSKIFDMIDNEIRPLELGYADLSAEEPAGVERTTVIEGGKVTKVDPKPVQRKRLRELPVYKAPAAAPKKPGRRKKAVVEAEAAKADAKKASKLKTADSKVDAKKTKASAKKAVAEKAATKTVASKKKTKVTKAAAPKSAAKKTATKKKVAAKVAKKTATKKAPAKSTKKKAAVSKKTTAKKTPTRKKVTKKKVVRKAAANKAVSKKTSKKASKKTSRKKK